MPQGVGQQTMGQTKEGVVAAVCMLAGGGLLCVEVMAARREVVLVAGYNGIGRTVVQEGGRWCWATGNIRQSSQAAKRSTPPHTK